MNHRAQVRSPHKANLRERLQLSGDSGLRVCSVPGCGRVPESRQGNGLSKTLCRYHRAYRARHGCAWKRSYTGPQLRPYARAAEAYFATHLDDFFVAHALQALRRLLEMAGPVRAVGDLPRL